MADNSVVRVVEQALAQTIGPNPAETDTSGGLSVYNWMVYAGDLAPPWWSVARDDHLVSFVNQCNHLAVAVYNSVSKMVGIPFSVVARDPSNSDHAAQARELDYLFKVTPGFGRGWEIEYSKFMLDYLCRDNGAFLEIIGDGPPDGPIVGRPVSLRHLDSRRITRTGNPIYPVLYADEAGRLHKIHWTRVVAMSQLPSSRAEMNGVGLCAVSRSLMISQNLLDIAIYKQEELGSRPKRRILLGRGITGTEVMLALRRHDEELTSRGHSRYGGTVAMGSKNTDIDLKEIALSSMEPFDEEVATNLGMYVIEAAFGMSGEIWPRAGRLGSQAGANLERMRARGRLPAQVTSEMVSQFNFKVLPSHLMLVADFRDDEEDQQRAIIRDIRGRNRERDMGTGALTTRAARLHMMDDGDITRQEFEDMELADGRLPDGTSLAILFYQPDPVYQRHLSFPVDPTLVRANDGVQMLLDIEEKRSGVLTEWALTTSSSKRERLKLAFHALDWLHDQYRLHLGETLPPVPMVSRRQRVDTRVDYNDQPGARPDLAAEQVIPDEGEDTPNEG